MMKIIIIFILPLMSGLVGCVVTGFAGGSVVVITDHNWIFKSSKYICKLEGRICTYIIRSQSSEASAEVGRFLIYRNKEGFLLVLIRRLKLQDAGTYKIGVGSWMTTEMNLKVVNDSCCTGPKNVSALPGQNITIVTDYPGEYGKYEKLIMKHNNHSVLTNVPNTYIQSIRFSVSDDKSAKVLSLNISNVRKEDDGIYLCGVSGKKTSLPYFFFFSEFQLHVQAKIERLHESEHSNLSTEPSRIITISVSICLALLLIGGIALLIYKLRRKRTDASTLLSKDNEQVSPSACDYDEIYQTKHANASNTEIYRNASSPCNSADMKITTIQAPKSSDQNLTYTTLSFPNNLVDDAVTFNKDSMTEYATVRHNLLK